MADKNLTVGSTFGLRRCRPEIHFTRRFRHERKRDVRTRDTRDFVAAWDKVMNLDRFDRA